MDSSSYQRAMLTKFHRSVFLVLYLFIGTPQARAGEETAEAGVPFSEFGKGAAADNSGDVLGISGTEHAAILKSRSDRSSSSALREHRSLVQ